MNTEVRWEVEVKPEFHCKGQLAKDLRAKATPWGFRKYKRIQCRNKGGNEHGRPSGPGESLQQGTISCGFCSPTKSVPSSFIAQPTQVTGEIMGHTTDFASSFLFVFLLHPWGPRQAVAPWCPQRGHPVRGTCCAPSRRRGKAWLAMDMNGFPRPTWYLWKLTLGKGFQVLTTPHPTEGLFNIQRVIII